MDQEVRIRTEEPNQGDGTPAESESHLVGLNADQVYSSPGHEQVHTPYRVHPSPVLPQLYDLNLPARQSTVPAGAEVMSQVRSLEE